MNSQAASKDMPSQKGLDHIPDVMGDGVPAPLGEGGGALADIATYGADYWASRDGLHGLNGIPAEQACGSADTPDSMSAESSVVDALQRNMFPLSLPRFPGLDIAGRYLPAGPKAQVGGNWYDVIALPGGRVALTICDVMGYGIRAVAIAAQLRDVIRALAALDLPPDELLSQVDEIWKCSGEEYFAACMYAVYDPVAQYCLIANAGHVPPLLIREGRRIEPPPAAPGTPIGAGGAAPEVATVPVADGDMLMLCTHGPKRTHEGVGPGIASWCWAAAASDGPLDAQCESLLQALCPTDKRDDVALVLARFRGLPARDVVQWSLQPQTTAPAQGRRYVRSTLAEWGLSNHSDITELLATELITNAIRRARSPIELRLLRTDVLFCAVTDDDCRLPVMRTAFDADEGGRGLQLVNHLAKQWGVSRKRSGKAVWFELALQED